MLTELFRRFVGRSSSLSRKNPRTPTARRLRMESLENRELLSVAPLLPFSVEKAPTVWEAPPTAATAQTALTPGEFQAIRSQCPDLNLTASMEDYSIIVLPAAQLSVANVQAAIDAAALTIEGRFNCSAHGHV